MGALGSDAAIEAADVVLMGDGLDKNTLGIKIAKRTLKAARQNVCFSLAIKIGFLLLALLGWAPMWAAVTSDVGVSLLAVLNSLKIIYLPLRQH